MAAPVGATPEYNQVYSRQMEQIILAIPEIDRTYHRTGEGRAFIFATLKPWEERERKTQEVVEEVRRKFRAEITGGQSSPSPVRPFGGRRSSFSSGVQLVLQGSDFEKLQDLGQQVLGMMRNHPMFLVPRIDPSPTKPQIDATSASRVRRGLRAGCWLAFRSMSLTTADAGRPAP